VVCRFPRLARYCRWRSRAFTAWATALTRGLPPRRVVLGIIPFVMTDVTDEVVRHVVGAYLRDNKGPSSEKHQCRSVKPPRSTGGAFGG